MSNVKIDVRGLCKVFGSPDKPGGGTEVLRDISFEIREALSCLGEITGEISSDDLLSNIFSRFCIGK